MNTDQTIEYINQMAELQKLTGRSDLDTLLAIWIGAEDAGIWGTRTDTDDSLQIINLIPRRSEFE